MNHGQAAGRRDSIAFAAPTIVVVALVGPGIGLVLWALGVALAPPWTGFTGAMYPLLGCAGLPLGIVAVAAGWLRIRGLFITLGLSVIGVILLLTIVGPGAPTGMTGCQPLAAAPPQVRYACVSTSSDNTSYRQEFILEGRAGWPILRVVDSLP